MVHTPPTYLQTSNPTNPTNLKREKSLLKNFQNFPSASNPDEAGNHQDIIFQKNTNPFCIEVFPPQKIMGFPAIRNFGRYLQRLATETSETQSQDHWYLISHYTATTKKKKTTTQLTHPFTTQKKLLVSAPVARHSTTSVGNSLDDLESLLGGSGHLCHGQKSRFFGDGHPTFNDGILIMGI